MITAGCTGSELKPLTLSWHYLELEWVPACAGTLQSQR
jgi:hypothetical protein